MAKKKANANSKGNKEVNKSNKSTPVAPKRRSRKKKSTLAEALEIDPEADDPKSDDPKSDDSKPDDDASDDSKSDDSKPDDDETDEAESDRINALANESDALYRLEPALLDKVDTIVNERKRVLSLIENTRQRASEVKTQIFSRVVSDYQRQLGEIEKEYQPVAEEISQSLMAISALEVKLREDIDVINDRIVEMCFRCEVGEFSKEELFPLEEQNRRELKHLNKRMAIIDETFDNCRPYLKPEDFEEATGRPFDPEKKDTENLESESNEILDGQNQEQNSSEEFDQEPVEDDLDDMDIEDIDDLGELDDFDELDDLADSNVAEELADIDEEIPIPEANGNIDQDYDEDKESTHFELWPENSLDEVDVDATMAAQSLKYYIVHKKKNGEDQSYPLGAEDFTIGRNPQNDLTLSDRGVSRRHAIVGLSDLGQYQIQDLSSGNGIYINGQRVKKKQDLNDGDKISIGKCKMVFLQRLE